MRVDQWRGIVAEVLETQEEYSRRDQDVHPLVDRLEEDRLADRHRHHPGDHLARKQRLPAQGGLEFPEVGATNDETTWMIMV
jgi:hypothetical protein